MQNQLLSYASPLKKVTFDLLTFVTLSSDAMIPIIYDRQIEPEPDPFIFRDKLLILLSEQIGVKVIKTLLWFTPKQPDFDLVGFAYLEDKTILPYQLTPSENLSKWYEHITQDDGELCDWLLDYSSSNLSMSGMSHEWEGKSFTVKDNDIFQATGKYLFEHAPKIFNAKKIASEKKQYLKKYINTIATPFSDTELADVFKQVVQLKKIQTLPGLTTTHHFLHEFEELTSFEFPADLLQILILSNGTSSDVIEHYHLLTAQQIIAEWKGWKSIYDDWLLEELKVHSSDGNKTLPMYTTPYWVPFLSDENGNFIAIDFAPGKKGTSGQIIAYGADESQIKCLAPNLISYFTSLI